MAGMGIEWYDDPVSARRVFARPTVGLSAQVTERAMCEASRHEIADHGMRSLAGRAIASLVWLSMPVHDA